MMLKSSLCNYSKAYILVKGTIRIPNTGTTVVQDNRNKKGIFKNCASFMAAFHANPGAEKNE